MTDIRPRIGFRTDATTAIGGGHVMRCLALAAELDRCGAEVMFYAVEGSAVVAPALGRSGFSVTTLSGAEADLPGVALDALVVDHYGLDFQHEERLRRSCGYLAVIDDLADRHHDCDLLIDTAFGRSPDAYRALAPKAHFLLGTGFALLRPAFAALRPSSLARQAAPGALRSILVSFGLSDPPSITVPATHTLMSMTEGFEVDVVLRKDSPGWAALWPLAAASGGRLTLVDDPGELAELMARADLMLGAGGVTSWERCCLGVPSVVVQTADNQADNVEALARAGAALVLAKPADITDDLEHAVRRLGAPGDRRVMSAAAAVLCDGAGARRVADAILTAINAEHRSRRPA